MRDRLLALSFVVLLAAIIVTALIAIDGRTKLAAVVEANKVARLKNVHFICKAESEVRAFVHFRPLDCSALIKANLGKKH